MYPVHEDPIDTLFRPTIQEIEKLFPNFKLVTGLYVKVGYFQIFRKNLLAIMKALRKNNFHALKYSFSIFYSKPTVSCILLRKNDLDT